MRTAADYDSSQTKIGNKVNDSIRRGILDERLMMNVAFDSMGNLESVYRPKPSIRPINGASAIIISSAHSKSRKKVTSLSDLVLDRHLDN